MFDLLIIYISLFKKSLEITACLKRGKIYVMTSDLAIGARGHKVPAVFPQISVASGGIAEPPSPTILKDNEFLSKLSEYTNIGAALTNLAGAVASQFHMFDSIQEQADKFLTTITKCGTALQGLIKSKQAIDNKNIFAAVGGFLELPISCFADGYNLWLSRGLSQGSNHADAIMQRIKRKDEKGNIITIDGKEQYYENFKKEGFLKGLQITVQENLRLLKECFTNPFKKEELTPRLISLCSSFMIGGSLLSFLGLKKIGAGIRDFGGATVDIAFMTDKSKGGEKKATHLYTAGCKWIGAAIVDLLKRFESYSSFIANPTLLSLFFDRWAAVDFIKEGKKTS